MPEMSFLRRVAGLSLRGRLRNSDNRERLRVDPLLLDVERSQLRWFGHLVRLPPGHLPAKVFRACPSERRPQGDTNDMLERSYLSAGFGTSWYPGSAQGEEHLNLPAQAVAPTTQTRIRGRK